MGVLHYGVHEVQFEDELLSHLQLLISTKLRRGENFMISWTRPAEQGGGRQSLWIDNGVPILFDFADSRLPKLSREWIDNLVVQSAGSAGIHITSQDPPAGVVIPAP